MNSWLLNVVAVLASVLMLGVIGKSVVGFVKKHKEECFYTGVMLGIVVSIIVVAVGIHLSVGWLIDVTVAKNDMPILKERVDWTQGRVHTLMVQQETDESNMDYLRSKVAGLEKALEEKLGLEVIASPWGVLSVSVTTEALNIKGVEGVEEELKQ